MLKKIIAENLKKWEKQSFAAPTQISITPTNLCNLKCLSCWQREQTSHSAYNNPAELPEQKLYDIINEAGEIGVRCVELTGGGEPLVRKDTVLKLIKKIKDKSMIGWMTSNGTLFTLEIIKLMIELEWDKLTISLDGPDAKTNDFLRPPDGTFAKITNTLALFSEYKKILNKNKPDITFNVVVSKYNVDKLSGIIELANKFGVHGVTFEPIKILADQCKPLLFDFKNKSEIINAELKKARDIANKNNIFTNIEELIHIPELIRSSGKLTNKIPINTADDKKSKLLTVTCIEPWFHIYLETDGNARPCCVTPTVGENISLKSLKDIWFGEKFSVFRKAIINKDYIPSCNQCNANLICFSREIQRILKKELSNDSLILAKKDKTPNIEQNRIFIETQKQIKILVTDTTPLYPPLWGGPKRIWNLFSKFSQGLFYITYAGVKSGLGGTDLKYNFNKINDNFREILCGLPAHYYFWHIFEKSFFKNTSLDLFLYLWMHTDWQFKHILNSQNADIIICSHPWSSLAVNKNKKQLFIYDAHNCEYLLMDKILGKNILKNMVLKQVKKIEGDACRKSDLILVCSEKEKTDFIKLYNVPANKIVIVTNGANIVKDTGGNTRKDCRLKLSLPCEDKIIVFIGAYYKPNIDAVKAILKNISIELKDFKFLIVGTVIDAFKTENIPPNVKFTGRVLEEQLEEILNASDIAINPMFEGSGINIKMLDYMSYGLPVITTECGARGIKTYGKNPMIICEDFEFINNIKILFSNNLLYKQMSEDGKALIAEQYNWPLISNKLENTILNALAHAK